MRQPVCSPRAHRDHRDHRREDQPGHDEPPHPRWIADAAITEVTANTAPLPARTPTSPCQPRPTFATSIWLLPRPPRTSPVAPCRSRFCPSRPRRTPSRGAASGRPVGERPPAPRRPRAAPRRAILSARLVPIPDGVVRQALARCPPPERPVCPALSQAEPLAPVGTALDVRRRCRPGFTACRGDRGRRRRPAKEPGNNENYAQPAHRCDQDLVSPLVGFLTQGASDAKLCRR